jgi:hypothetical protein
LREDDIVEKKEGGVKEGGDVESGATRMVCGRDEKEGWAALYTSVADEAGNVGRNNVGAC